MNINNIVLSSILVMPLVGCTPNVKTVYRDVARPMLVCPAPPRLKTPELYITLLTEEDYNDYGKVAQYYNISIRQLLDQINKYKLILERYDKTSESYLELNAEFELMYKHQRIENEISGD